MKLKSFFVLILTWIAFMGRCADCAQNNPKTLVLIICSDNLPLYKGLQEIWRSYMHQDPEHFECYFIRSDPELFSEFYVDQDVIWSRSEESVTPGILNKTLLSLEAMLPRLDQFDYVLRTNLSSFFVFPRLLDFLKNAPQERFYCGIHHGYGVQNHEAGWVCGAGILMSTDLAKMLVSHKKRLFNLSPDIWSNIDDVAIADLFAENGVQIVPSLYREILSLEDWKKMSKRIPKDVFHFRIKTPEPDRMKVDLFIHSTLLSYFYSKKIYFKY